MTRATVRYYAMAMMVATRLRHAQTSQSIEVIGKYQSSINRSLGARQMRGGGRKKFKTERAGSQPPDPFRD